MNSIFEVSPKLISDLSDIDFKELMVRLTQAEVHRYGYSTSTVTHGGNQDTKDGGVDIRVTLGDDGSAGYLPRSNVIVQVKATEMGKAGILREMKPKERLRNSILRLAEQHGSYIIASSKDDLSDLFLQERLQSMRDAVSDAPKAASLELRFYDRSKIADWTNEIPSVALWVLEKSELAIIGWRPFGNWAGEHQSDFLSDGRTNLQYKSKKGNNQQLLDLVDGTQLIRDKLAALGGAVRLVGLSGVGKTRLLQALFDPTIGTVPLEPSLAIYADSNDSPTPSPTALLHRLQVNNTSAVLLVDNCSSSLHHQLVKKLTKDQAISLITVEYDVADEKVEGTEVFKLEPASEALIGKFLSHCYPFIVSSVVHKISTASEGNWRIANMLAESVDAQDDGATLRLASGEIFRRLFWQNKVEDPQLYAAAQACALVYSFGVEPCDEADSELLGLAALAGCTPQSLFLHVAELKRRNLVQARSIWRAILPHVLARKLAADALENFPHTRIQALLADPTKPRLLRSFLKRLGELEDVECAAMMAELLIQRNGMLSRTELFSTTEVELLELIAPLIQKQVLTFLKYAILAGNYPTNQQAVLLRTLSLLIKLAYEANLFSEAFETIIHLVSRTAEPMIRSLELGKISKLFQRELSGTNATIQQRLSALQLIADSKPSVVQSMLPKCLEAILQTTRFSTASLSDFGSQLRGYGLQHQTREEYFGWYFSALNWCQQAWEREDLRLIIAQVLAANIRGLMVNTEMTNLLLPLCQKLATGGALVEVMLQLGQASKALLKKGREEDARLCDEMKLALSPVTLQDRLEAYLSDELFHEVDGSGARRGNQHHDYIETVTAARSAAMAIELLDSPAVLHESLPRLVACNTRMLWHLMREFGRRSLYKQAHWQELWRTYQALPPQSRTDRALSAFITGVDDCDERLADALLHEAFKSEETARLFIELHANLKLTTNRFSKVLQALQSPGIDPVASYWLTTTITSDQMSSSQAKELLAILLSIPDGVRWAVELVHSRLYWSEVTGKQVSHDDLQLGLLLLESVNVFDDVRDPSRINRIAKICLPEADRTTAGKLLTRLKRDATEEHHFLNDFAEYLSVLAGVVPAAFLDSLVAGEAAADWRRTLFTYRDLSPHPLKHIPECLLDEWASSHPVERWLILAASAPLWQDENGRSDDDAQNKLTWRVFSKRILAHAPDAKAVLDIFYERFFPMSWSGSRATLLRSRLPLLQQLREWDLGGSKDFAVNMLPKFERAIHETQESEELRERLETEHFEY